jgi:hypothetical protein
MTLVCCLTVVMDILRISNHLARIRDAAFVPSAVTSGCWQDAEGMSTIVKGLSEDLTNVE